MQTEFGVFNKMWIIIFSALTAALLLPELVLVSAAPLASNESPFPLEFQPPLVDNDEQNFKNKQPAFDSYGNPVNTLKPIETPDGRKVISAQGLQFEIPNYASGITEIKQPADDLLPPFIDPIAVAELASTEVDVENAELVELKDLRQQQQQQQQESVFTPNIVAATAVATSGVVPAYLLELNDPDVGGPTDYMPKEDGAALKVIAWDLLPPYEKETMVITEENYVPKRVAGLVDPTTNNVKVSLATQHAVKTRFGAPITQGQVSVVNLRANSQTVVAPTTATNTGAYNAYRTTTNSAHKTTNNIASTATAAAAGSERVLVSLSTISGSSKENDAADVESSTQYAPQAISNSRGSVHYSTTAGTYSTTTTSAPTTARQPTTTTTRRPTTTTTRRQTTSTTTTRRPTTTTTRRTTTTTTRRPTTTRPTTTTSTTTTAAPLDPSTFYMLEAGDSYTLPAWLADFEDPDLDAAVLYVVPEDIKEYNQTVERDLLPPLEPFVDLNNINLPAPAESTTQAAPTSTTRYTTTTSTTKRATTSTSTTTRKITTTTTRRPTASTTRSHWVRANPTTPTTQQPTTTTTATAFSFTTSPSTITTSGTTFTNTLSQQQHQHSMQTPSHTQAPSVTSSNQNSPTTTVDPLTLNTKIESDISAPLNTKPAAAKPFATNPFLHVRNNGAYQPQPFSGNSGKYTTTRAPQISTTTTTTTPTTTTTTPAPFEKNPFDTATIPAWLTDFDYPDIGPGVPFVYDPEDPKNAVFNDLLPPSNIEALASNNAKPVFVSTSPASLNSFNSLPSTTTLSSFSPTNPSNINTHSFNQNSDNSNQNNAAAVTQPPFFFVPPASAVDAATNTQTAEHAQQPSTSINHNFAAPFEPAAGEGTKTTDNAELEQEGRFPPFSGSSSSSGGNNVPTKTTFTKSDEGKVITTNVFPNTGGGDLPQAAKPFNFNAGKDFQAPATASPNGFGSISSAASGFTKTPSNSFSTISAVASGAGGRYTGSFGGAPGILGNGHVGYAVQADGSIRDPDHTVRPLVAAAAVNAAAVPTAVSPRATFVNRAEVSTASGAKYHGTFGGPPGVLVPFDNLNAAKP